MRVLVTGSRKFADGAKVARALEAMLVLADGELTVTHGAHPWGADALAQEWARVSAGRGAVDDPHPADWAMLGRRAGPFRNQHMVNLMPDVVLAFFWRGAANTGTTDCVTRVREADAATPVIPIWGGAA